MSESDYHVIECATCEASVGVCRCLSHRGARVKTGARCARCKNRSDNEK